jgi:galactokinase
VIGEIERTVKAAARIRASDWPKVGELMYASHRSLRDDYEVSCRELDALVEIAESIGLPGGVFGCRMTGGGFGGCVVALVRSDSVAAITKILATRYKEKTGLEATIFGSRPAAGASILKVPLLA